MGEAAGAAPDLALRHWDLIAETRQLGSIARMQIAPEQGPLLTLLVRLIGATRVVEVGTFTGLSSLALAKGLPEGGTLVCFDVSDEWTSIARRAWRTAGVDSKIELRLGDARQTLSSLHGQGPVDLAFVDADKDGYIDYLELLLPHLRAGGLLVFDNTLSRGAVLDEDAQGQRRRDPGVQRAAGSGSAAGEGAAADRRRAHARAEDLTEQGCTPPRLAVPPGTRRPRPPQAMSTTTTADVILKP